MYKYDENTHEFVEVDEIPEVKIPQPEFETPKFEPAPQPKRMSTGKKVLIIVLAVVVAFVSGVAGGIMGAGVVEGLREYDVIEKPAYDGKGDDYQKIEIVVGEDVTVAEAIAAKVMPSVVGISTVSTQYSSGSGFDDFFGFGFGFGGGGGYNYDVEGVGSGFIVDPNGYILTNSHVVNDGDTKSITVSLYDGEDIEGEVLWNDSTLDLAVVKVNAKNLPAVDLGDSDSLKLGSYAAVIGNPLGLQFERSISQGIISGLNRTIRTTSEGNSSSYTTLEGVIQTDATINAGNSGGPILNSKGEVVGISTARSDQGENMGFAIPINTAKPIVEQIKETGSFKRAYLGIKGIGLEEQTSYTDEQLMENFNTKTGVYISSITGGSHAEEAGLKAGDIILSVDGKKVGTMNRINAVLLAYKVGDKVELEVMRDGDTFTTELQLIGEMDMNTAPKLQ